LEIDFRHSMENAMRNAIARASTEATRFNYNKLQAVACIVCSSAVSIGCIYWIVRTVL
jgi:hypothetical protein